MASTYTVQFNGAHALRMARTQQGKFSKDIQRRIYFAHRRAAWEVQAEQRDDLERKVQGRAQTTGFPARRSRHLRSALESDGNALPLGAPNWTQGFQVGIPSFLDTTPAKPYWRNLEEGTALFVGRPLLYLGRGTGSMTGLRDMTNMGSRRSDIATRRQRGGRPRGAGGQFRRPRGTTVTVEDPIPAYRYLEQGSDTAMARLMGGMMRRFYIEEMPDYPIRFQRAFGRLPGRGGR